jgi:hypothetical protein
LVWLEVGHCRTSGSVTLETSKSREYTGGDRDDVLHVLLHGRLHAQQLLPQRVPHVQAEHLVVLPPGWPSFMVATPALSPRIFLVVSMEYRSSRLQGLLVKAPPSGGVTGQPFIANVVLSKAEPRNEANIAKMYSKFA